MTYKQAIERTVRHWREDYKKLHLFGGQESFGGVFTNETCPLCRKHFTEYRRYKHDDMCGRCPLNVPIGDGCVGIATPYSDAHEAAYSRDKPAFMAARAVLLKRLKRALAKYK